MASIFMRFPQGLPRALTLSYDDGVEQDEELVRLMQQFGLKGTFNLNSGLYAQPGTVYAPGEIHRRMTQEQTTALLQNTPMEVAVHSYTHPFLEQLPPEVATREILTDRLNLEEQFGTMVRGMAYPYGTFSQELLPVLKSCGIAYARTVNATRLFTLPENWLWWHPTCHHNDPALLQLLQQFLAAPTNRAPLLFYMWGHSYEFEQQNNWSVFKSFAQAAGFQKNVWYATNIEIYQYAEAFRQLQFSAAGTRVYNPTATVLWLVAQDKLVAVEPAQTLVL